MEALRHGILVNRVNVLVRILKLALCHIHPIRLCSKEVREVLPIVKELR